MRNLLEIIYVHNSPIIDHVEAHHAAMNISSVKTKNVKINSLAKKAVHWAEGNLILLLVTKGHRISCKKWCSLVPP